MKQELGIWKQMHVSSKPFNLTYAIKKCPPALDAHPRWWGLTLKPCPTVPNASPNNWKLTISVIIAPNTAPKVCLETKLKSTDSAIIIWSTPEVFDTEKWFMFIYVTMHEMCETRVYNFYLIYHFRQVCQLAASLSHTVQLAQWLMRFFTGFHTWFAPGLPTTLYFLSYLYLS